MIWISIHFLNWELDWPQPRLLLYRKYCLWNQLATNTALTKQNFTLKYDTNIPCLVVSVFTTVSLLKGPLCDIY